MSLGQCNNRDDWSDSMAYAMCSLGFAKGVRSMPMYKSAVWFPKKGEEVNIKVVVNLPVRGYRGLEYEVGEVLEKRYYLGTYDGRHMVTDQVYSMCTKVAYFVNDVFEITKKEYTMIELAKLAGVSLEDFRIKE